MFCTQSLSVWNLRDDAVRGFEVTVEGEKVHSTYAKINGR